jgi:hypothetical protein
MVHKMTCQKKYKTSDWSAFGLFGKYRVTRFPRCSRKANGQVECTQTPCQGSICAKMGTTQSGKHIYGNLGGKWEQKSELWGRKASSEMGIENHCMAPMHCNFGPNGAPLGLRGALEIALQSIPTDL